VDEVVSLPALRKYMLAFTDSVDQNPKSLCPHNHLIIPRIIKG
jgi:glutaconyl-CoA decarboxylase subunit alpha